MFIYASTAGTATCSDYFAFYIFFCASILRRDNQGFDCETNVQVPVRGRVFLLYKGQDLLVVMLRNYAKLQLRTHNQPMLNHCRVPLLLTFKPMLLEDNHKNRIIKSVDVYVQKINKLDNNSCDILVSMDCGTFKALLQSRNNWKSFCLRELFKFSPHR